MRQAEMNATRLVGGFYGVMGELCTGNDAMNGLRWLLCMAVTSMVAVGTFAQQIGGSGNGTPFDLQGCIDKELKAGNRRIVVPPGRYWVTPKYQQHLVLRDLKDVSILAEGVEMICTETTRALTISHCTNVTVRGLVIDYDPLPFTQGRITGLSPDKSVHEIELFEGYPGAETARNFKYEIFAPDTRTLRCDDHYPTKVEIVDARHIRIVNPGGSRNDPEQVNDLIVIGSEYAPHGSAAHAVECDHNVNVRLEDIDLFASNCFGFLETNCDASVYQRCRIDRRPAKSDPVKRADPRLRSLDADAFHSKHAVKGPSYVECTARFMGDDCVNICGDYHMITSSQGSRLRVLAKGEMNIQPGDPVELVGYDGRRVPDAKAVSVQPDGAIRDEERTFISKQHMDAGLKAARGALTKAYTVTLDREVDIAMGGVICSANRIGNGFAVKNCTFGFNRSRGILIKASRGEVSDNRLEGCWMSAVLVTPEYWWLEAGSSSDVRIVGNRIAHCKGTAISVTAMAGNGGTSPAGAHRNIEITGNTIIGCPLPNVRVTSTDDLRVEHNTFELPVTTKSSGRDTARLEPVSIEHCDQTVIRDNGSK